LLSEVNNLFDQNFWWVIVWYMENYVIEWYKKDCDLIIEWWNNYVKEEKSENKEGISENKEEISIDNNSEINEWNSVVESWFMKEINRDHFSWKKMSAEEFCLEFDIDWEMIDDLNDLEDNFERLFYTDEWLTDIKLEWLVRVLEWYSQILYILSVFKNLNGSLTALIWIIKSIDINDINSEINSMLCSSFKWVFDDLRKWKKDVFIIRETNDINYLDDSLLSSIKQIENDISWEYDDIWFEMF